MRCKRFLYQSYWLISQLEREIPVSPATLIFSSGMAQSFSLPPEQEVG